LEAKSKNITHQKLGILRTKKGVSVIGAKVANLYQHKVIAEPSKHQRTKKWNQKRLFCNWFQTRKSI